MRHFNRIQTAALALLTLSCLTAAPVSACVHPETAGPAIVQSALRVLVAHAGGREVLVWAPRIYTTKPSQSVSLVTAVPTMPSHYGTTPLNTLDALDAALFPPPKGPIGVDAFGADTSSGDADSVILHPEVKAGPYEITPIQATGPAGINALNAWLQKNGFTELPQSIALQYVQKNWTFLAVRVTPPKGQTTLSNGKLPALQLAFDSPQLVVPLKMEAGMGKFDARVYMAVAGNISVKETKSKWGFTVTKSSTWSAAPSQLKTWVAGLQASSKLPNTSAAWHLTVVAGAPLNAIKPILDWDSDFELAVTGQDTGSSPQPDTIDAGDPDGTQTPGDVPKRSDDTQSAGLDGASADGGSPTPSPSPDNGCTAGTTGHAGGLPWLMLMLGVLLWRRRIA